MNYYKKSPCNNCPYRKDAPIKYWHKDEFEKLLEQDSDTMWGNAYGCHKKDGHVCIGWLMNQDERRFPSIMLRLSLIKNGITREYLDTLNCKSERFKTIEDMINANYPELLKTSRNNKNHKS